MNNPSTPPRSRSKDTGTDTFNSGKPVFYDNNGPLPPLPKKFLGPPATPQKNTTHVAPVTPSTVNQVTKTSTFKSGPFLFPPQQQTSSISSPFNGLKSPEFTPCRRTSIPNIGININNNCSNSNESASLKKISRVLFPAEENSDEEVSSLLPPSRSFKSIDDFKTKQQKVSPGTPSHKITTFEQSQDWYNNSGNLDSSDEEEEESAFIKKTTLPNPFQSDIIADEETRAERKAQLLRENPDIEDTITYVNKRGQVVKQRKLSEGEKERFKPRMLFQDELQRKK